MNRHFKNIFFSEKKPYKDDYEIKINNNNINYYQYLTNTYIITQTVIENFINEN